MTLFHPLQENVKALSDNDIAKRIRELTKKVASHRRFGRNPELLSQLSVALDSYREELRTRRIREIQDRFKKARGEPELGDLINID
tara:strand:- start:2195 stop:2452 length:258 start_codon:yes stop_codon:yes gene_type:complete